MCFGLMWFESLLIWIIVICGVVALLKLLIAFVLPKLGVGGEVLAFIVQAITIIIWVVVCCFAVYVIFSLIACLLGGGLSMPRLHP